MNNKLSKGGRPTNYNAEFHPKLAFHMGKNGMIDREIAEELGICEKTLNNWKKRHSKFLHSLRRGKFIVDAEVANALYQRAVGYDHTETRVFRNGKKVEILKHYPPDTKACFFWLRNRQPEKWRDKPEVKAASNIHFYFDKEEDEEIL